MVNGKRGQKESGVVIVRQQEGQSVVSCGWADSVESAKDSGDNRMIER